MAAEGNPSPKRAYKVKIHHLARPVRDHHREAGRRAQEQLCLAETVRNLIGIDGVADENRILQKELGITNISANRLDFFLVKVNSFGVYYWVSTENRTIYILHQVRDSFLSRFSRQAELVAADRLMGVMAEDARLGKGSGHGAS